MVSAVRESISVLKPEIISFSEDPKDYHRFVRCFEANMDERVEDSGLKLNYFSINERSIVSFSMRCACAVLAFKSSVHRVLVFEQDRNIFRTGNIFCFCNLMQLHALVQCLIAFKFGFH